MTPLPLINISPGNSKLGSIPSVSLIPGKDCGNCGHCFSGCYARKIANLRPKVLRAWARNSILARNDRGAYFGQLNLWLNLHQPKFFRFHVGGDIPDQDYLDRMILLARECPSTRFLAFTKMFHLSYRSLPPNLKIRFSRWPGDGRVRRKRGIPFAWMQDGTEKRMPGDSISCLGGCEDCTLCWEDERDVIFKKH